MKYSGMHAYEVEGILAKGGQGMLYLVSERKTGKQFVGKEMLLQEAEREWMVLRQLQRCSQRYFPVVQDYWQGEKVGCLLLEYLPGMNLQQLLGQQKITGAFLLQIMKEVLYGLRLLHNLRPAVVWGDLKAENIMVLDSTIGSVKLIDFGAAMILGGADIRCPKFGTAAYAAPEQRQIHGICDERTDLYAFGAVFLELGRDVLPRWVKKILRNCTKTNPGERYQTAAQVLYELKATEFIL